MTKAKLLLLPLLLMSAPAAADPIDDGQLWATESVSAKLSGNWVIQGESITRFGQNISRLYQQETVGLIGYKASKQVTLYEGYANVVDFLEHRKNRVEHRPFQQLNLDLGKIGRGSLTARTRFEERFIQGAHDMGLRFRQQLRYAQPVAGKLSAYGSAEFFFTLNDTDWGQHSGFDRWRIGTGLRHPIGKSLNLEIGYLNQYGYRANARDTMDHILTTSLAASF